ncbi:MAG: hypothetical protein BroJett040_02770 [Oligoflexia bacterium]|nr:MAG: hypothetical protein BroJett040_02770 [Oligoflexia bacterium]
MLKFRLTKRLAQVLKRVHVEDELWDVCCDHGYLGLAALSLTTVPKVYFVDQVTHLIQALPRHERGQYICAPGEEVKQEVKGTLVIIGVGDYTITTILRSLLNRGLLRARRIILGPHKNPERIENLDLRDYVLSEKITVDEKGRERKLYIFDKVQVV